MPLVRQSSDVVAHYHPKMFALMMSYGVGRCSRIPLIGGVVPRREGLYATLHTICDHLRMICTFSTNATQNASYVFHVTCS